MRKILLLTIGLILVICFRTNAQQENNDSTKVINESKTDSNILKKEPIFILVQQMPEFPGGLDSLNSYFVKNVDQKLLVRSSANSKVVFLTFVIEKDGSITDIMVLKSVNTEYDNEAIRLINNMPKWIPGKHNGVNVRIQYNVKVKFNYPYQIY